MTTPSIFKLRQRSIPGSGARSAACRRLFLLTVNTTSHDLSVWALQQISTGFASWLRYCTDVAQRRSTKLCTMVGRLLSWYTIYTTPWAIKRSQLIFVCNFVKNQRILMQFSLIDLEMNGT